MKKLESSFVNMALVLTAICVLAALLLSAFFSLTEEVISQATQEKQTAAISEVLPMENLQFEPEVILFEEEEWTVYNAYDEENYVGTAVESYSNNGFNGLVRLMVGFDANGKILNYAVLDQKETPGLGTKMVEWFKPQQEVEPSLIEKIFGFEVKKNQRESSIVGHTMQGALAVKNDGGSIDAITAATISSRAFLDAVNKAYFVYLKTTPLQRGDEVIADTLIDSQDSLFVDSVQVVESVVVEQKSELRPQRSEPKVENTRSVEKTKEIDALGSATPMQQNQKSNEEIVNTSLHADSAESVDTEVLGDTVQSEIGEKNNE